MTEQATAQPLTTEEKAAKTCEALQMGFHNMYLSMLSYLDKLPGHPQLKMHAMMNLDQASFWAMQFIQSSLPVNKPLAVVDPNAGVQTDAPATPDTTH